VSGEPSIPTLPTAPAPGGVASAGGVSGLGFGTALFAVLCIVLAIWSPALMRALRAKSALWRPTPFLALFEQPG
jgi:hypothetical protein